MNKYATIVIGAHVCVQDLNIPYDITAEEIVEGSSLEMMLFMLYLYQTLPQFIPRTIIEYNCKLGETVVGIHTIHWYTIQHCNMDCLHLDSLTGSCAALLAALLAIPLLPT